VCMCVCIYTFGRYVCTHVYVGGIDIYIYAYIYIYIYIKQRLYCGPLASGGRHSRCVYTYVYVYMYLCAHAYVYIYIYIYIYIR
jgi:hypothetical protein